MTNRFKPGDIVIENPDHRMPNPPSPKPSGYKVLSLSKDPYCYWLEPLENGCKWATPEDSEVSIEFLILDEFRTTAVRILD